MLCLLANKTLFQALVAKLLAETWKYDGYIRWLRGIKATYAMRRDWMVCHLPPAILHRLTSLP